ncbi:MAG: PEP-CTERM sorting domain-containing protein [Verrucomicrobiota bacterium]|jgi:hypothetical protein
MKNLKTSFANRVRSFRGALIAILLASSVVRSEATLYTINYTSSGNAYSATYDGSQNGFTVWSQNGANQLALQWLYYSINGGPVTQLTSTSVTTGNAGSGKKITVNYAIPDGTLQEIVTFTGYNLSESIRFNNTSGGDLNNVSIFQYSDFVLGGSGYAGSQTVSMTPASGGYAYAYQSGGGLTLTWNGDAIGYTTLVQADSSGAPFGAFTGSGNLNNTTLTANNTSAVFGYEFSGSVANGNFLTISENTTFPDPVPEPSSLALISSGMLAVALIFRQRRGKKA